MVDKDKKNMILFSIIFGVCFILVYHFLLVWGIKFFIYVDGYLLNLDLSFWKIYIVGWFVIITFFVMWWIHIKKRLKNSGSYDE